MKIEFHPQGSAARRWSFPRRATLLAGSIVAAFAIFPLAGCDGSEPAAGEPVSETNVLDNDIAYGSYGLGHHLVSNVKAQFGDAVDLEALILGVGDGFEDTEVQVTQAQFMAGIQALAAAGDEARASQAGERLAEGRAFLAENKQRDEVVELESGLQYEVLTSGDGPRPEATDVVSTHYEGRLLSGQTFDSSLARGEPAQFPVDGVIAGWVEALQLMPVGSRWRLFVPPELAYGEHGAGGVIGPNETLIFDVELLEIVDQSAGN
jgi:FKBP-type peptidyl-prolyl cis-trans isomerase FklB